MFADCKTPPSVVARQEQAGLAFELIAPPRLCVDDRDPGDIYAQAARLRVTNLTRQPQSLVFEGGSTGHIAFGVKDYAPAALPQRASTIEFGPIDQSKRTQDRLELAPGASGEILGRSSYILKIIDTARRDMDALGKRDGDSVGMGYQVNYQYQVAISDGQVIGGGFSAPLTVWFHSPDAGK